MDKIKWAALKPILEHMPRAELLALIKDLFNASADGQAFFAMRFFSESQEVASAREPCRQRIAEQFFPKRGFGKLNLRSARKAITDYRKATRDTMGVLDLMLTYVENGTRFTCEYGDIDEPFYNSLVSMFEGFVKLIRAKPQHYTFFRTRLLELAIQSSGIGWGYCDDVNSIVEALEKEFGHEKTDA